MAQKINPVGIRIGINKTWTSNWFADGEKYKKQLLEDHKIREYLKKRLENAGIDTIFITRSSNIVEVEVRVARPGVVIGRAGSGIEEIKKELRRMLRQVVDFKVKDLPDPDLSAQIIANNIGEAMKKGMKHRVVIQKEMEKAMTAGAKGIRIWVSGDFASPKHSRTDKVSMGFVPLQTLRADIDYALSVTKIKNAGKHGIKVWINKGEKTEVEAFNKLSDQSSSIESVSSMINS